MIVSLYTMEKNLDELIMNRESTGFDKDDDGYTNELRAELKVCKKIREEFDKLQMAIEEYTETLEDYDKVEKQLNKLDKLIG